MLAYVFKPPKRICVESTHDEKNDLRGSCILALPILRRKQERFVPGVSRPLSLSDDRAERASQRQVAQNVARAVDVAIEMTLLEPSVVWSVAGKLVADER